MREILFRGKRIDNDEWLYGSFCMDALELKNGPCGVDGFIRLYDATEGKMKMYEVDRETVGQFTGLTDKNGKKIFEGDVVKDDSGVVYPVVFCLTGFCLKYAPPHSCGFHYDLLPLSNYWHAHGAIIEVIGNIHDNPELLEVSGDG